MSNVKEYYASNEKQTFYQKYWGGESIHVGIYLEEYINEDTKPLAEYIREASHFKSNVMANLIKSYLLTDRQIFTGNGDRVQFSIADWGAGYGGTARTISNNWSGDFQFNFDDVATFGIGNNMPITQATNSQTPFNTSNSTNLSAFTSTGNENIDAIITTEEYFVADVVYNDNLQRYWLISDPDIQRSLTGSAPSGEGCSMIRIDLPNYGYQCVMPYSVGRAEPQLKRLSTSLDFSRRTLEFDPDSTSALFNAYVNREFPSGISGGTNSSVTVFTDINGSYLATPDGFRNEAGVWMNNVTLV